MIESNSEDEDKRNGPSSKKEKKRKKEEKMRGYEWIKKAAAVLLAASMVAAAAGCSAGSRPDGGSAGYGTKESGTKESGTKGNGSKGNESDTKTADVPKGRYVEQEVTFPFEKGEEIVLDIIKAPDGTMVLFTQEGKEANGKKKEYRYDGSSWNEVENSLIKELSEEELLLYSAYDASGTLYLICADEDYKPRVLKLAEGKSVEEPAVIDDSAVLINGLHIEHDGTLLIPSGDHVLVIGTDGTAEKTLPQRSSYSNFCDSHTLTANTYITCGDRGFLRYDLTSLNEIEVIPYQSDEEDLYGSLAAGEGDDFYLANPKGIHHMTNQGTIWETVVDGSLNSMSMPSVYVKRLFTGENNDFYLWYTENETAKMAHYTFDPEMASVPSKTLTVYGLNLSENQTMKQAASLFQMEHPDVRVELIDGSGDSGSALNSDTIRSLNTELLNGNGADVLVLDGLPVKSYIEKGILEDLKEVLAPMMEAGELYPNIADHFTGDDGSIYQFPVRVGLPIIYGNKSVMDQMASVETIRAWQEANPDRPVFPRAIYETILRQLVFLYYAELDGNGDGQLEAESVKTLLETAKLLGDANGSQVVFDESADGGRGKFYNTGGSAGLSGLGDYGLLMKEAEVAMEEIDGMEGVMLPYAIAEKYGYQLRQINDIYFPKGLLGITEFSREKETAREFLAFVLSPKVQESDLRDGFPVSSKSAGAWLKRTSAISVSVSSSEGGGMISAEYPDDEKKKEVMGMLDRLHTPISVDEVLMEMIVSETKGYFEGTQTAEEAAGQFENKAKLYYAE